MTKVTKKWIQSYPSCQQIFPLALDPATIRITDIIWALSQKNRFTGHTKWPYSVAQHCVLGAEQLPPAFQLPFLLHEVSEAYLPDVSAPVKPALFIERVGTNGTLERLSWEELESEHADIILPAIGLGSIRPLLDAPEVKRMDLAMLAAEKNWLLGPEPAEWGLTEQPAMSYIERWTPDRAAKSMLEAFNRLTGRYEAFP